MHRPQQQALNDCSHDLQNEIQSLHMVMSTDLGVISTGMNPDPRYSTRQFVIAHQSGPLQLDHSQTINQCSLHSLCRSFAVGDLDDICISIQSVHVDHTSKTLTDLIDQPILPHVHPSTLFQINKPPFILQSVMEIKLVLGACPLPPSQFSWVEPESCSLPQNCVMQIQDAPHREMYATTSKT